MLMSTDESEMIRCCWSTEPEAREGISVEHSSWRDRMQEVLEHLDWRNVRIPLRLSEICEISISIDTEKRLNFSSALMLKREIGLL